MISLTGSLNSVKNKLYKALIEHVERRTPMYRAGEVADYVIRYSIEKGKPVDNLKLQKILYYIQAAFLVEKKQPAFQEEICAWKYGPVVESVYHKYKYFIDDPIDQVDELLCEQDHKIDIEDEILIRKIVDSYEMSSAIDMVIKTHSEAPWKNAFKEKKTNISINEIEDYYIVNQKRLYGSV